ncbi:2-C-methyl-D-erythritol 4-phosphate cytidylyltransferase [Polycyclovorans algicola]|uniref:2-C-methyl-D-erythritol 4-phosphate cytidylyltransferase n=1 Tax=Polycyclovorans algicola TaxID=616992 RepID=UPI0004A7779C|nr:2-C-methyl-D-erythritol 4-phosphate cytidylyltransferase [Polycyclovorans algicola]
MSAAPPVWAVIVAAGRGTRFGAGRPKVHQRLLHNTVLGWSCEAFVGHPRIDAVVLVHAADDPQIVSISCHGHPKLTLTLGGDDRASSVRAGLAAARAAGARDDTLMLVHDGARPCVSPAEIDAVIEAAVAAGDDGALLALPVTDTLKRHHWKQVQQTMPRDELARALTPQAFRLGLLDAALAAVDGAAVTDESSAMEQAGYQPRLVWGQAANLKITYAEDLALAAFWLQQRSKSA